MSSGNLCRNNSGICPELSSKPAQLAQRSVSVISRMKCAQCTERGYFLSLDNIFGISLNFTV